MARKKYDASTQKVQTIDEEARTKEFQKTGKVSQTRAEAEKSFAADKAKSGEVKTKYGWSKSGKTVSKDNKYNNKSKKQIEAILFNEDRDKSFAEGRTVWNASTKQWQKPKAPEEVIKLENKPKEEDKTSISSQIKKASELPLGHPGSLKTTGLLSNILLGVSAIGGISKVAKGLTTVAKAAKVGAKPIAKTVAKTTAKGFPQVIKTGAKNYKTNTKTLKQTESWLNKIFKSTTKTTTSTTGKTLDKLGQVVGKTAGSTTTTATTTGIGAALGGSMGVSVGKGVALGVVGGGLIVGAVSSYPFSLFVKEEALQSIKGSYTGAMIAGDDEAALAALDERDAILDPNLWDKIVAYIPYANSVNALLDLVGTAVVAAKIDRKITENNIFKKENGLTDDDIWKQNRAEEREADQTAVDYYNNERQKMFDYEQEAKQIAEAIKNEKFEDSRESQREADLKQTKEESEAFTKGVKETEAIKTKGAQDRSDIFNQGKDVTTTNPAPTPTTPPPHTTPTPGTPGTTPTPDPTPAPGSTYYEQWQKVRTAEIKARNEDAAFWAAEREKQALYEAEDRKAIADFWIAYRKEANKLKNDTRPSNLNFGLL